MRQFSLALIGLSILIVAGCASKPPPAASVAPAPTSVPASGVPPLEPGWSRLVLSAGRMSGEPLSTIHQVGPVTFKGQVIAQTAKDVHTVVDVRPGTYPMSCAPAAPDKNYAEEKPFTFAADKTYYLACDMETKGPGMFLGLPGMTAAKYLTGTHLDEQPLEPGSKLIAYAKLK